MPSGAVVENDECCDGCRSGTLEYDELFEFDGAGIFNDDTSTL